MQRVISGMLGGAAYSVFVSGPEDETGYVGHHFLLKFQDPKPAPFRSLLDKIVALYASDMEYVEELFIVAIEISADFYVRRRSAASEEQFDRLRWQMVDLMRRHLRPEPVLTEAERCRPRFFGAQSGASGATFVLEDWRGRATAQSPHLIRLGVDESFQAARHGAEGTFEGVERVRPRERWRRASVLTHAAPDCGATVVEHGCAPRQTQGSHIPHLGGKVARLVRPFRLRSTERKPHLLLGLDQREEHRADRHNEKPVIQRDRLGAEDRL